MFLGNACLSFEKESPSELLLHQVGNIEMIIHTKNGCRAFLVCSCTCATNSYIQMHQMLYIETHLSQYILLAMNLLFAVSQMLRLFYSVKPSLMNCSCSSFLMPTVE